MPVTELGPQQLRGRLELDQLQQNVVNEPLATRLIVEAGPGCGKTEVACARVARALGDGLAPDALLLLSFTRTAVHEMRKRIACLATPGSAGHRLEVRTIDSLAWRMAAGSGDSGRIASYEEGITAALNVLRRRGPEITEYISRFRHVLVDEAQDLVGPRAELIAEFLEAIPDGAGWTVFMDPAQAIYGWSSEDVDGHRGPQFLDFVPGLRGSRRATLATMHRTGSPVIRELLDRARHIVTGGGTGDRLEEVRALIRPGVDASVRSDEDLCERIRSLDGDGTLLLFRRRADVFAISSRLSEAGVRHRLRVGGLPRGAAAWLAVVTGTLARRGEVGVTQASFAAIWDDQCEGTWLSRGWTREQAWELFVRLATGRGGRVDLSLVPDRLATMTAPEDAYTRELGPGGPIVGTIHGSKGREANRVIVTIPDPHGVEVPGEQIDEEARVLYVAVSRARQALELRERYPFRCGHHEGRAWHSTRKGDLQIEIGREGDVDATWPLRMERGGRARAQQDTLQKRGGTISKVVVSVEKGDSTWTRRIFLGRTDDNLIVGALSSACVDSLGDIVKKRSPSAHAPTFVPHLWWVDTVAVALHRDDTRTLQLPQPWSTSRIVLAPVITGMGLVKMWRRKS